MKWNHLPVAGGVYDQHPDLMDKFHYIFVKRADHEDKQRKKDEQERNRKMGKPSQAGKKGRRR